MGEQELEDAFMCSCSIPFMLHWWPNFFRKQWFIDPGSCGFRWPSSDEDEQKVSNCVRVVVTPLSSTLQRMCNLPENDILIEPLEDAGHAATALHMSLGLAGDIDMMMLSFVEGY